MKNKNANEKETIEKDKKVDPFHLEFRYPNIEKSFMLDVKPIELIKDHCIVVLDTNVLLLPYTVGSKGLDEIKKTYKRLITEKRLIIPGQVARDFLKNRPNKLTELHQQIANKKARWKKLICLNILY